MEPPVSLRPTVARVASAAARPAPHVLVAIPCFNEELAIGGIVLRARHHADEVLVVDDGSSDRTIEVARLAGATVLESKENQGKGRAIRRAFRYARDRDYDVLVLMDGDGQHDPAEIPLLLEPVTGRNGKSVDVALGFRHGTRTEMPLWRRFGKRVLDYATAAGGAGVVVDSQCGYRAFNRRAILELSDRLRGDGFEIESEQLVHARDAGLTTENVTISCRYDGLDTSTKGPVEHAYGVLANLIEMTTMRRPLLTLGLPSVALLVVAVVLGIRTLQWYNTHHIFSMPMALGTATLAILGAFGLFTAVTLNLIIHLERRIRGQDP